jgi:thioredoxin-like negative regulator of GroEL
MKKVIMFSAAWCQPCQRTKPAFNLLKESSTDVSYEIVDVDENEALAQKYNIRAVPTFLLLKEGNEVARASGGMTADKIREFANQ